MTGFLVSPSYHAPPPEPNDIIIASIVWGCSIACSIFTAAKAIRQLSTSWKRSKRLSRYIIMVWLDWLASVAIGILAWFFLRGKIEPSFQFFFSIVCLWTIQVQLLTQIIINRISLLWIRRSVANRLKWTVAAILGLVNISVFIIWIPAQLQISKTFIHANEIWDKTEKGIFAIIDSSLNAYFIYLIRKNLISDGLTKYKPLFWFNVFMICISLSMDVIVIGTMSLRNGFIFIQFEPLMYLVKLHIEMNNADLIIKIVKANQNDQTQGYGMDHISTSRHPQGSRPKKLSHMAAEHKSCVRTLLSFEPRSRFDVLPGELKEPAAPGRIRKTVSTTVTSRECEDKDMVNEDSSTKELQCPSWTDIRETTDS